MGQTTMKPEALNALPCANPLNLTRGVPTGSNTIEQGHSDLSLLPEHRACSLTYTQQVTPRFTQQR